MAALGTAGALAGAAVQRHPLLRKDRGYAGLRGGTMFCCDAPFVMPDLNNRALWLSANAVTGKFYSREEEKIRLQLQRVVEEEQAARAASGARGEADAETRRGRELLESAR